MEISTIYAALVLAVGCVVIGLAFEFMERCVREIEWSLFGPPKFFTDFSCKLFESCSEIEMDEDVKTATAIVGTHKLTPAVKQKVIDHFVQGATIAVTKLFEDR